jgi:hypothetical protein
VKTCAGGWFPPISLQARLGKAHRVVDLLRIYEDMDKIAMFDSE